jgi:hypothetical protein
LEEPVHLAASQIQQFGGLQNTQSALTNLLDGFKPM